MRKKPLVAWRKIDNNKDRYKHNNQLPCSQSAGHNRDANEHNVTSGNTHLFFESLAHVGHHLRHLERTAGDLSVEGQAVRPVHGGRHRLEQRHLDPTKEFMQNGVNNAG